MASLLINGKEMPGAGGSSARDDLKGKCNSLRQFKRKNYIFLKWFPYDKRNEAISESIGAKCYFVHSLKKRTYRNAPFRYLIQFLKTLLILFREKPDTTFVTNPPIFAAMTVAMYSWFSKSNYIMDSHTGAFVDMKFKKFDRLHRFICRRAIMNIVTTPVFESIYRGWGANTFILSDLLVTIPKSRDLIHAKGFVITVPCSFAMDEPIEEIIAAASELPEVQFYLTGNYKRYLNQGILNKKPDNLELTGFIPDQDYFDLLHSSNAIMVLVKKDNTMQQGAYEAISIKKPLVLSNWKALRELYPIGCVFVDNKILSIRDGIIELMQNYDKYLNEMRKLYETREMIWTTKCKELIELLEK